MGYQESSGWVIEKHRDNQSHDNCVHHRSCLLPHRLVDLQASHCRSRLLSMPSSAQTLIFPHNCFLLFVIYVMEISTLHTL